MILQLMLFVTTFDINRDGYDEEEHDSDVNLVYIPPPIHDVWLN